MPSKKKTKIDSPFVSVDKLLEAIQALKKVSELRGNEKSEKKQLIEDQSEVLIKVQINYKKIPYNKTTYIHSIPLPHHWRHESDFETCLIVKDDHKKPLTDRELDLDETKSHYKELLSKSGSEQLVTEILPMRELRNEYKLFEAKQKLSKSFDVFLCDRTLLHNKFDYLPRLLGKTFWLDDKKVPIPVDLTSATLKTDIESKLNQTFLYLSGKGDTSVVNIGLLNQSNERLIENLLAVTKKVSELFADNIRSLSLRTGKSISITFFLDCGFINDIQLEKRTVDNEPIEEDFSHFIKSNIQIYKNGAIKVVPKPDNEINSSDESEALEDKWLSISQKAEKNKKKRKRSKKAVNFVANKRFKRKKSIKNSVQKSSAEETN